MMLNRAPSPSADASVADGSIEMRLTAIVYGGEGTNLFEFRTLDGADVPPFTAGAHVDVNLPNGTIRQYSIASSQTDCSRYLLGVKLEEKGRGGSRFLHEQVRVGHVLKIGLPRNHFPLNEQAAMSVLIAGGIGVTPMLCMAERLRSLDRPFRLHYAVRTRGEALLAHIDEDDERIDLHIDVEQDGRLLDIAAIVAAAPLMQNSTAAARRRCSTRSNRPARHDRPSMCTSNASVRRATSPPPTAATRSSSRNRSERSLSRPGKRCCRRCRRQG